MEEVAIAYFSIHRLVEEDERVAQVQLDSHAVEGHRGTGAVQDVSRGTPITEL